MLTEIAKESEKLTINYANMKPMTNLQEIGYVILNDSIIAVNEYIYI